MKATTHRTRCQSAGDESETFRVTRHWLQGGGVETWQHHIKHCTWPCCLGHTVKQVPCPVVYNMLFLILTIAQESSSAHPVLTAGDTGGERLPAPLG